MQVAKKDIDKMVQFINYLAMRSDVTLSVHDKQIVKEINEAYDKAMQWHKGQLEYKKEFRKAKQKDDPLYSRSKEYRERYAELHPEVESPSE